MGVYEGKAPRKLIYTFNWDKNDVLLVQLSDEEYKGKGIEPMGLQKVRDDVIRVVVQIKDSGGKDGEAARRYMTVEKGSLDGFKFIVETEDGERLNTN